MTVNSETPSDLPRVAIVTPIYNGGKFLAETMDCVQAQTYPNLVHIVLDNNSSDNTAEVIAQYQDAKVPVIKHTNKETLPITENWNTCVNLTPKDAKYFRLLCADDLMTPDFIEKTVAIAETDDEITTVCTKVTKNDVPVDFNWPDQSVIDGDEIIRRFFKADIGFFAVHSLMRTSILENHTPLFDATLIGMDFEALLAIIKGKKMGMVHEELGWVRIHEGSQTSTVMLKKNTHFADWHTALYRHGKEVFTAEEFAKVAKRYERYYLGQCRGWLRAGGTDIVQFHMDRIAQNRSPITQMDKLDSMLNGVLTRIGLRQPWTGWPN